jgi:hypothetical protein
MDNKEQISADYTSDSDGILDKKNRRLIVYHIIIPGCVGGIAKASWDYIETTSGSSTKPDNTPPVQVAMNVSGSIFLGAFSALIGILVLTDLIDLKKSLLKIFGYSLAFGFVFPVVLSQTGIIANQMKIIGKQDAKITNQTKEISSIGKDAKEPGVQQKILGTLESTYKSALTKEQKLEAIKGISDIGIRSSTSEFLSKKYQLLDEISKSQLNDAEVKKTAADAIETLKKSEVPR